MAKPLLFSLVISQAVASDDGHKVNPIRRVVTMLQMMQNKVAAEADKKEKIFDNFMCYCNNADSTLGVAIDSANKKIPLLESSIEESTALKKTIGIGFESTSD